MVDNSGHGNIPMMNLVTYAESTVFIASGMRRYENTETVLGLIEDHEVMIASDKPIEETIEVAIGKINFIVDVFISM